MSTKIKNYASLELAKKLKEIGFNEPCGYSYTVYTSDFIYDGDPDHPESHKKGDIRIYDFYNTNSDNEKHTYSLPHLYDVQAWFRERDIIITPELEIDDERRGWTVSIAHLESGASQYNPKRLEKYEDALLKGCLDAVRWYIKPNKTDSNEGTPMGTPIFKVGMRVRNKQTGYINTIKQITTNHYMFNDGEYVFDIEDGFPIRKQSEWERI